MLRESWIPALVVYFLLAGCYEKRVELSQERVDAPAFFQKIIAASNLDPEQVGFLLADGASGQVLLAHNSRKTFIPASVLKLLSTIMALHILDGSYSFNTELLLDGEIEGGQIRGDLVLRGGGDPDLRMEHLLALLKAAGLDKVRGHSGNFYYDESKFPARQSLLQGKDAYASYNPGLSALSLERNLFALGWQDGKIEIVPPLPMLQGQLQPGKITDYKVKQTGEVEEWTVETRLPQGLRYLPVKQPALYTAQVFRALCHRYGLALKEPGPLLNASGSKLLARHRSAPLQDIVREILFHSNNIMAELVFQTGIAEIEKSAKKETDSAHSPPALDAPDQQAIQFRQAAFQDWARMRMPAVSWSSLKLEDGSGLSSGNEIAPEQLASLLLLAEGLPGVDFEMLLPLGGWNGTLVDRLRSKQTALRIQAKSGTLAFAVSTAGYLYAKSGRRLIFALFINDKDRRRQFEAGGLAREGSKWIKKHKKSMDDILALSILQY